MNGFMVEVPAETNPLNETLLHQTLQKATSSDPNQIQTSTKQLQEWETKPGYFRLLQNIFLQSSSALEVRLLSLIQLKNGIDKYWRKSANNAIRAEERAAIRANLLQSTLNESNDRLATLNAIVTAKIARYDFPGQWPDLITQLINVLKTTVGDKGAQKQSSRALLITHNVVKELATVRLARSRAAFLSAAPELFEVLKECYFGVVQLWQNEVVVNTQSTNIETLRSMNTSDQVLKIVRRLVVAGYEFPHRHDEVGKFWDSTATHVQVYLQLLHQEQLQNAYRISASEHLKQLAKLHVNMAKEHPVSFALLPNTPALVKAYWSAAKQLRGGQLVSSDNMDDDMSEVYDAFNLRAVLLLRASFKEAFTLSQPFKYRNSDGKDEPSRGRRILTDDLLKEDFVKELFEALVRNFFVYVQSDAEGWMSEPEEWEMKDESSEEAYDRSVRAASERLFLDITLHFKDLVIQPLLSTAAALSDSNQDSPTLKDAVYSALGIAAPILHSKFNFDSFLRSNIVSDMQQTNEHYSIVRRRIAIILAQWLPVDISDENRPLVYEIFQNLLNPHVPTNNLVVKITAGKRLKEVTDEMQFNSKAFGPYASNILKSLLDLIQEVSLPETKLALLQTISTVVERMEQNVSPFATLIVDILQTLWQNSGSENMMKVSIVSILSTLVTAMKTDSAPLHSMMLSIINVALEPGSEYQTYLLEDALDLWAAIVEYTRSPPSQEVLAIVPLLFHLLEMDDSMLKALRITKSYVLLAPSEMLQDSVRDRLLDIFQILIDTGKVSVVDAVTEIIELMVRAAEALGGESAVQVVTGGLLQSQVLIRALQSLLLNWESHQTTGPKRKDPPPDWKNETNYYVVLSRILLPSTQSFLSAVGAYADSRQEGLDLVMSRLLEECFSHMDAISRPTDSKLVCMALTKLLETGQPWILGKLQDLMTMWTSMIVELRDEGSDDHMEDTLVLLAPIPLHNASPEDERKSKIMESDPVYTTKLSQFVGHHLRNAINLCGGDQRFREEWLVNVDEDVVKSFGQLGIM